MKYVLRIIKSEYPVNSGKLVNGRASFDINRVFIFMEEEANKWRKTTYQVEEKIDEWFNT